MGSKLIKALVVDDSQTTLTLISRLLASLGVDVLTADCGRLAVEMAQAHPVPFDIIFLDICMPEYNGNQVAQELRQNGFSGTIIAFTAAATAHGQAHSKKSGIDKYLGKQTISKELLSALLEAYCVKAEV